MSDRLRRRPRVRGVATGSWLDDPVGAIGRAAAATEAAHTSRVAFVHGVDIAGVLGGGDVVPPPSRGSHRVGRRFARGPARPFPPGDGAEGVVDFDRRLVAMDFGFYAEFVEAEREWRGPSGRPRSTLPERPAGWAQPLWMVDLLYGVVAGVQAGEETVRGEPCVRLAGRADLALAERECGRQMPTPDVPATALAAIPVHCWVDEGRLLRRLRVEVGGTSYGAELFDFGVWVDRDWLDMPTFRSPAYDDG